MRSFWLRLASLLSALRRFIRRPPPKSGPRGGGKSVDVEWLEDRTSIG